VARSSILDVELRRSDDTIAPRFTTDVATTSHKANPIDGSLMKLRLLTSALLAASLAAAVGCGGKTEPIIAAGAQGDERLLALGQEALDNEKWTEARGYLQQLLDSYPRSQLAGDARLGIADSYFHESGSGNLVLAIAEYRDFLTFFPNHPRADYAQFQIASGHYRQVQSPDRDQEPTLLAAEEFEKLIELYRNSRYAVEGRALLEECYNLLAEAEFGIGTFYLNTRKHCRASIPRFLAVIDKYPSYAKMDEVHFRLGTAYQLCRQPNEALMHLRRVIDDYPDSVFREEAQSLLATLPTEPSPPDNAK
jgi:outer membrane protein assembly factor BamD